MKIGASWVHLRTCQNLRDSTRCCDSSPNKHRSIGDAVISSADPGEQWLYCYPPDPRDIAGGPCTCRTPSAPLDRASLVTWCRRNRERSQIFRSARRGRYYSQPIALRHPIVFYEGHLPAFSFNTLVKKGSAGRASTRGSSTLFARGIDPDEWQRREALRAMWPSRDEVQRFADEADRALLEALAHAHSTTRASAARSQAKRSTPSSSTRRCIRKRCSTCGTACPSIRSGARRVQPRVAGTSPPAGVDDVPAGRATLGADAARCPSAGTTSFPACVVDVPAFRIDVTT